MNIDQVFGQTTVWQMGPSKAITLEKGRPLKEAVQIMRQLRVGCITIVDQGKVAGVFTERDLCKKVIGILDDYNRVTVDAFMTADPDVVSMNDSVGKAIAMMNTNTYRHLPVVNATGELVGLFSVRAVLNYLAEYFHKEILNLPPKPDKVSLTREGE